MLAIAEVAAVGFTTDLEALLNTANAGAGFRDYLKELEVRDILDLALLASTDDKFDKVLTDAELDDKPREKVKARKAWFLAREARDQRTAAAASGGGGAVGASNDDGPLGHGIVTSLRDGFFKKHNYHLSGSRLLNDSTFNSLYRGLHFQPRRLRVIMLENVKSMNTVSTSGDLSGVLMSSQGGISNISMSHVMVASAHDLWKRFRIIMSSVCYIMMAHVGFLNWETTEHLMEYVDELIFNRLDGYAPDVAFFDKAYLMTMNYWSNELRTKDSCTLEEMILARTGWVHFWTNYMPTAGPSNSGAIADMNMLPADLVERVNQQQALTRSLQSQLAKKGNTATGGGAETPKDAKKKKGGGKGDKGGKQGAGGKWWEQAGKKGGKKRKQ